MERKFCELDPNCLKFHSLIFQHVSWSIKFQRYRTKNVEITFAWKLNVEKFNILSTGVLWVCGLLYKVLHSASVRCQLVQPITVYKYSNNNGAPSHTITIQRQGRKVHCAGSERCYCIRLAKVVGAISPRTVPLLPLFMDETPKACVSGRWRPYRPFTLTNQCQLFHDMQFLDM